MQYTRQSTVDWYLAQIDQHEECNVDGLRLRIEVGKQTATTQTERGRSEAMMAAHAAEIAGQRQHRMVTKGDANGNGPQSRSDPKGRRRDVSLKHKHYSRRVVTAGDAVSWHDRIRVPAAAHDMDEAWGRACSTTYVLPKLHARPPQQRRMECGRFEIVD